MVGFPSYFIFLYLFIFAGDVEELVFGTESNLLENM